MSGGGVSKGLSGSQEGLNNADRLGQNSGLMFPPGLPRYHQADREQGYNPQGYPPYPTGNVDPNIAALVAQMAATHQLMASHMTQPRVEGLRKESDKIVIPPIPKVTELKSWERDVHSAVLAASGHDNLQEVAAWLFECNASVKDPDTAFEMKGCPKGLQNLDAKLGVALANAIKASGNSPLQHALQRLQTSRQHEGKAPWGGRRILWEVQSFLGMAHHGEHGRTVIKLADLRWYGDSQANMEK